MTLLAKNSLAYIYAYIFRDVIYGLYNTFQY